MKCNYTYPYNPDLHVQVIRSIYQSSSWAELKCVSSCPLAGRPSYVWYRNGQKMKEGTSPSYADYFNYQDSYSCAVKGHEDFRSPSVYAPKVPSVLVSPSGEIVEGSSVTLTCSSDANPAATYTWYKKNGNPDQEPFRTGPQLDFVSIQSSDSAEFYCTVQNKLGKKTSDSTSIDVKYGPKMPSLMVRPSGEIVEGSSVTLTCSSDADPPVHKYTWYRENQTLLQGPERSYNFSSISSEDTGTYHCQSENQHGRINSSSVLIDVQYAPNVSSVSVWPSGEIVEGSSVNLTCSSDANPAATYTWYKKKRNPSQKPFRTGPQLDFVSIQSSDSGEFYCTAQNELGGKRSDYISIDVKYAPKVPSVSMSPSGEIVEGSSVTLTCSSDANPAANYTWYKKNGTSPKALGQTFTITNITSEHSGEYYCEAQNKRGHHNSSSTLKVTVVPGHRTAAVAVLFIAVPLVVIIALFCVYFLWISIKRNFKRQYERGERTDSTLQRQPTEQQDELYYATIRFTRNNTDPLYSNINTQPQRQEEGEVQYATVNFKTEETEPGTASQGAEDDPSELYSKVQYHKNMRV
ncbi:B-cell receptor CD22-like [Myripristis murdjan]|uniref:B-cell receptor CD22-like n=1 Tax=Myripristis murdjan TaxID=586833 RepID=UPI0011762B03|nr:B-cell receptor CD22-like [Myripristis murdjan]